MSKVIELADVLTSQPHTFIEKDGVHYTLLGTAHISQQSVQAVEYAITHNDYDAIAVELDAQRLQALTDPSALAKLDLVHVIRKQRVALFAANLALAAFQRRLAQQLGVDPGAELKRAVEMAQSRHLPVYLIDRDVGVTLKRASSKLGLIGRIKFGLGLVKGLFAADSVESEEIEQLKTGDMLKSSFGTFASENPKLYETIIAERDRYMAIRLRQETAQYGSRNVLVVIGAGHLEGLSKQLRDMPDDIAQQRASLEEHKTKKNLPWFTIAIIACVVTGIIIGFVKGGLHYGGHLLVIWTVCTGLCAALGALVAGSHILSILTAACVAPLKPFRMSMPTGGFAALVELHRRKPYYNDFLSLRDDIQSIRGCYKNRVSRILLIFLLTNIGNTVGVLIAVAKIAKQLHHH